MCECPAELKFNVEAIDLLIRSHLLNMREFDLHLVQVCYREAESVHQSLLFKLGLCLVVLLEIPGLPESVHPRSGLHYPQNK